MKVTNISRVDYKYRMSQESPIIAETKFSNTVYTTILNETIVVQKSVDKSNVSPYDILCYKIVIINISNETVNNIKFTDILPEGIKFINNTMYINEELGRCFTPISVINLGSLGSKGKIIITFKGIVDRCIMYECIENHCVVKFDYIYNVEEPPLRNSVKSNESITRCKDDLFKAIMIKDNIKLPDLSGCNGCFIRIKTKTKIIRVKIAEYAPNPKMCNVVLIGKIIYAAYYIYGGKLCIYKTIEGFSTAILVPRGVEYFKNIKVKVLNEDSSYVYRDKSKLLISTSLLIKLS